MKPKPSAAPAPTLGPDAPRGQPGDFARAHRSAMPPNQPLSAADEIADMISSNTPDGSGDPATFTNSPDSRSHTARDPLFFRRTAIPILLTFSAILTAWGILLVTCGPDNAMADLFYARTPLALFSLSALFLVLGVINILSLKNAK